MTNSKYHELYARCLVLYNLGTNSTGGGWNEFNRSLIDRWSNLLRHRLAKRWKSVGKKNESTDVDEGTRWARVSCQKQRQVVERVPRRVKAFFGWMHASCVGHQGRSIYPTHIPGTPCGRTASSSASPFRSASASAAGWFSGVWTGPRLKSTPRTTRFMRTGRVRSASINRVTQMW